MDHSYAEKKRADVPASHAEARTPQPALDALRSGAVQPTREQMGHRVDLPDAMREKMESAFGADLSAVKLYESEAVADAGANAITRGSDIAFAPGMLDFSSYGGQALLGHEISHVVSQARGEVTGGGFLNDHALEARADREGAMAASGQQAVMPAAAMSSVTAASAAGPMQADKNQKKFEAQKQVSGIESAFLKSVYYKDSRLGSGSSDFTDAVQGASPRAIRQISKNARAARKKYDRQQKGIYTLQEQLSGEDDPGMFPGDRQRYRDDELLRALNMERAVQAVRAGKSFRIDKNLDMF